MPEFQIESVNDQIAIISFEGPVEASELQLQAMATQLIRSLLERQKFHLVLDLANADYFGATFLSIMLRLHSITRKSGGAMAFVNVNKSAQELLHILDLETLFEVYENKADAIEAVT